MIKSNLAVKSYAKYLDNNFKNLTDDNYNNVSILVEFHGWSFAHICYAYLLGALKKKYPGKIYAYEGYRLISNTVDPTIMEKIRWRVGQLLNLKTFSIYRSLGTKKFIRPVITKKIINKVDKFSKKINFKTKNQILDFKIKNIIIGDLIYDTYLKKKGVPTISLSDQDFRLFFIDCLKIFFYWDSFVKTENIRAIIITHSAYLYGMIMRIALNYNIKVFKPNFHTIYQIKKKNYFIGPEFYDFKKLFKKLSNKQKKTGRAIAKKQIDLMFKGKKKFGLGYGFKNKKINKLKKNKKVKILIAMHNFYDSPHVFGKMLFPDFYEWLKHIVKLSKITDYEWFLKLHPENNANDIKHINSILKNSSNIKIISHKTNQNEIISSGIKFVLTCFGSIGYEYAYKNITVINACVNNPHADYSFTHNPRSIKEFDKIILNIKNYKLKINKKEILEFLYTRRFYSSVNWLNIDKKTMADISNGFGWKKRIHRPEMYLVWLKNLKKFNHEKIIKTCTKFVNSNHFKLSPFHLFDDKR